MMRLEGIGFFAANDEDIEAVECQKLPSVTEENEEIVKRRK
jgi:hypothetical protein